MAGFSDLVQHSQYSHGLAAVAEAACQVDASFRSFIEFQGSEELGLPPPWLLTDCISPVRRSEKVHESQ